jgi:hypothetical protein
VKRTRAYSRTFPARSSPIATFAGIDLRHAKLAHAALSNANLQRARLDHADLTGAYLDEATFAGPEQGGPARRRGAELPAARLVGAYLVGAYLSGANLARAQLMRADLGGAVLHQSDLSDADLTGADLQRAVMVETKLSRATLTGCKVYGLSAWGLALDGAVQRNLVITRENEPQVTVDNLEVAQFLHLLLRNEKIRDVIDTITTKVVLILGRFTPGRKAVLDALRDELRSRDYLPVLFDFEKPAGRDVTETVSLLARMARFVVADITDARSIPQELGVIVPHLPSVPVQPLLLAGSGEYGMFEHFRRYPWVLPVHVYASPERLIADLGDRVIAPAEVKVRELRATPGS